MIAHWIRGAASVVLVGCATFGCNGCGQSHQFRQAIGLEKRWESSLPTREASVPAPGSAIQQVAYTRVAEVAEDTLRPARELAVVEVSLPPRPHADLTGVRKVLVVPLVGANGIHAAATDQMIQELWNSGRFEVQQLVDGDGHFSRMAADRAKVTASMTDGRADRRPSLLQELVGKKGRTTPEADVDLPVDTLVLHKGLMEEAKRQGADAILLGEVITYKYEDIYPNDPGGSADGGMVGTLMTGLTAQLMPVVTVGQQVCGQVSRLWGGKGYQIERVGQVHLYCRLVDVKSQTIRVSRDPHATETAAAGSADRLPRPEVVLRQALGRCVREVVAAVAPPRPVTRSQFVVTRSVEEGVKWMREGREEQGHRFFEAVVQDNPKDDAACYNLGLIEEARGDLVRAAGHFQAAFDSNPSELYHAALRRVEQDMRTHHARRSQELTAPNRFPAIQAAGGLTVVPSR